MTLFSSIPLVFTVTRLSRRLKPAANTMVGILLLLMAGAVCAHDGQSPKPGEWVEKRLVVRHDSNWSTEHCFTLKGSNSVAYHFAADILVDFDFHVHPVTVDGGYHTDHLDRKDNIRSREGQVEARAPGTYCFNFIPVEKVSEDKKIHLFYRID